MPKPSNLLADLVKIHRTSARYESPAWGYESTASYFNQVLLLHTAIEPELLMQGLLAVEQELGRERLAEGYADRLIDIDILSIDATCTANGAT